MKVSAIIEELPYSALKCLEVRPWREEENEGYVQLLDQYHYLKAPAKARRHLSQVVLYEGQAVALLSWSTAAYKLAGRERFIGWDARTRQKRLGYLVQNNRFLLLPKKRPENLASRVLGLALAQMPGAWQERYGKRPLLAETFVDPEGYRGTCYHAAGWIKVGGTAGFARVARDFYVDNKQPKDLWVKALGKEALERLRDPSRLLPGEQARARVPGGMPVSAKQAQSLAKALQAVPDPRARAGRQFPLGAMLATSVLALCCGARTVSDIFRFCQDLKGAQRRSLGFRPNPKAPAVVPPPGEGCWRDVLRRVDPGALAQTLNQWMQSHRQQLPALLSIDGKVIGQNLATIVSLVDARDGQPLAQAAAAGNGQEHKLARALIEALPEGSLEGKTVKGDALYAHKALTRTLVQECGADILLQLKANQKTTFEEAARQMARSTPPFYTPPSSSTMAVSNAVPFVCLASPP